MKLSSTRVGGPVQPLDGAIRAARLGGVKRSIIRLLAALSVLASGLAPAQDLPDSPQAASAVWIGDRLIQWGGFESSAAIAASTGWALDPTSGLWTMLPDSGLLEPRAAAMGVWTGEEALFWGGQGAILYGDGGRFNPGSSSWEPMSNQGAPTPRVNGQTVWTGSQMLVWGGYDFQQPNPFPPDGGRYDSAADVWMPMSTNGAPEPRNQLVSAWTGAEFILWGGYGTELTNFNDGALYNPSTDTWRPMTMTAAPSGRSDATAVWSGSEMIVWGGAADGQIKLNDGARYNPVTDTWTPISSVGAPRPRRSHVAVWTGSEMIVWGGTTSEPAAIARA